MDWIILLLFVSVWSSSPFWEGVEYSAEAIVITGAALEVLADFEHILKGDANKERRKRVEKGAAIALVIGLAIGLAALVRTNQLFTDTIGSLYGEARDAHREARDAGDGAKTASEKATSAIARNEILEAEAKALRERTEREIDARIVLEKQLLAQGPRWVLLEAGKKTFIKALKPYAGQSITVVECGTWGYVEPEPFRLEQDILNFAGNDGAGWKVGHKQWARCPAGGVTSSGGNLVTINSIANEDVKKAAKALFDVLNGLTIGTVTFPILPNLGRTAEVFGADSPEAMAGSDPTTIFLLIGPNPMFDVAGSGRAKAGRRKNSN